ncbi:MAG: hypothetical protein QOH17_2985 [Pseudonocardiales bacterium]|nr:hypothetical protein [Pseudonocardiales bacterium]
MLDQRGQCEHTWAEDGGDQERGALDATQTGPNRSDGRIGHVNHQGEKDRRRTWVIRNHR